MSKVFNESIKTAIKFWADYIDDNDSKKNLVSY